MAPKFNNGTGTIAQTDTLQHSLKLGYRIARNRLFVTSNTNASKKYKKSRLGIFTAIECAAGLYGIKLTTARQLWATLYENRYMSYGIISEEEDNTGIAFNGGPTQLYSSKDYTASTGNKCHEQHELDETGTQEAFDSEQYEAFDGDWFKNLDIPDHQTTIQRLEQCEVEILELLANKEGLSIYLPAWKERGCAPSRGTADPYYGGDGGRLWNGGGNTQVPAELIRRAGAGGDGGDEKGIGGGDGNGDRKGQDNGGGGFTSAPQNGADAMKSSQSPMFGEYEEVDQLQSRILMLRREVLGLNHPDTLAALADLAQTTKFFGQAQQGEAMEQEIARWREDFLSQDSVAPVLLADTSGATPHKSLRDRSDETRTMEVLELRREILGSTSPEILVAAAKFGQNLSQQDRHDDVEALLSQYLHGEGLLVQGTDTALLLAHIRTQSYDEIDSAYILNIEYKKLRLIRGDGPPLFDVVWYMQDLVNRWYAHGHNEKAKAMEIEIHELKLRFLDRKGAQRMSFLEDIADRCCKNRQYEEAESFYMELLELKQKILGRSNPETIKTINSLAEVWNEQRQNREAECLERQLLQGTQETHDIEVILSMHEQAQVLFQEAYPLFDSFDKFETLASADAKHLEMIQEIKRVFGGELSIVAIPVQELSDLWVRYKNGHFEYGHKMRRTICSLRKVEPGVTHTDKLTTMSNLAKMYSKTGCHEKAKSLLLAVLEAQKESLGVKDPETIRTMKSLLRTLRTSRQCQKADVLEIQISRLLDHEPYLSRGQPTGGSPIFDPWHPSYRNAAELSSETSSKESEAASVATTMEWGGAWLNAQINDKEDESEIGHSMDRFDDIMEVEEHLYTNPWAI